MEEENQRLKKNHTQNPPLLRPKRTGKPFFNKRFFSFFVSFFFFFFLP